jgi:hypothetical protein
MGPLILVVHPSNAIVSLLFNGVYLVTTLAFVEFLTIDGGYCCINLDMNIPMMWLS